MEGYKEKKNCLEKQTNCHTYCLQNIKSFSLFSIDSLHKIMSITFLCNHKTITQHVEETYLNKIEQLNKEKKLSNVKIQTAWLSNEDYASLLGSADLGVSLHTSSSGVDLPMKVVDMFGTGLPVIGWSRFEAWKELVKEGVNGFGFSSADGLETLLEELFRTNHGQTLAAIRRGALEECSRRWGDEWFPVAGKLLGLEREGDGEGNSVGAVAGGESKVI